MSPVISYISSVKLLSSGKEKTVILSTAGMFSEQDPEFCTIYLQVNLLDLVSANPSSNALNTISLRKQPGENNQQEFWFNFGGDSVHSYIM